MQYKCQECNDTGSRDKIGAYFDCNACDAAATRRDLNDFVKSLTQRSTYPVHPEDVALAIHQRALAMVMSASVEDTLNEMQPGGALHMPQEPVAHLKFWAAQSWSGNGNHDIDCGEGLEVCEPGEIGADGLPAFPVFMHAIPGALAMAPKQEAPVNIWQLIDAYADVRAEYMRSTARHLAKTQRENVEFAKDELQKALVIVAAPAAANGALTDERAAFDQWSKPIPYVLFSDYAWQAWQARAILAAAGPDAALVKALEQIMRPYGIYDVAVSNAGGLQLDFIEIGQQARAALSGAKGN